MISARGHVPQKYILDRERFYNNKATNSDKQVRPFVAAANRNQTDLQGSLHYHVSLFGMKLFRYLYQVL